jgi:hypothetical protein
MVLDKIIKVEAVVSARGKLHSLYVAKIQEILKLLIKCRLKELGVHLQ